MSGVRLIYAVPIIRGRGTMKSLWRLRTLSMFVVMSALLMALGALIGAAFGSNWMAGSAVMLAISVIVCFCSYFFSKEMALKANHVHIITEKDNPRLYGIVREVAQLANLPMPEVGISETDMPNAFATGRNPQNAAVVATRGILRLLSDEELKGVIAHEMSHVKNRDILVMSIASAIAVIISYVSRLAYWIILAGDNRENRGPLLLLAIAAEIFIPIAALLVQLGISRNREYLADETGAKLIRNPRALARALDRLESGIAYSNERSNSGYRDDYSDSRSSNGGYSPSADYAYAHMWIENPMKSGSALTSLFSTHPATADRIARLNKLADEMGL
jgi:heat shock protein HtpX